jgi:hypothetical protein
VKLPDIEKVAFVVWPEGAEKLIPDGLPDQEYKGFERVPEFAVKNKVSFKHAVGLTVKLICPFNI